MSAIGRPERHVRGHTTRNMDADSRPFHVLLRMYVVMSAFLDGTHPCNRPRTLPSCPAGVNIYHLHHWHKAANLMLGLLRKQDDVWSWNMRSF